jgi:hypothetical protein
MDLIQEVLGGLFDEADGAIGFEGMVAEESSAESVLDDELDRLEVLLLLVRMRVL